MKNVVKLTDPDEIREHIYGLWRTDLFREQQRLEGSYIHTAVENFTHFPRMFFEMSQPDLETAHFSVWWSCVPWRRHRADGKSWYKQPAISDLYYLHEIIHGGLMRWTSGIPFNRWYDEAVVNEFTASLATEVNVYLEYPELRPMTFDHDIWADRFLNNEGFVKSYRTLITESSAPRGMNLFPMDTDSQRMYKYLFGERKRAMTDPDPFNWLELQIHKFIRSNMEWAMMWRHRYQEIEDTMAKLQARVDSGADWNLVVGDLLDWLRANSQCDVPFLREAETFSHVYHSTRDTHGNRAIETSG